MEDWKNDTEWGESKYFVKKQLPQCYFSNTNFTQTDLGMNLSLRGERMASNRLRLGIYIYTHTQSKSVITL
jgi:hypothetical protein